MLLLQTPIPLGPQTCTCSVCAGRRMNVLDTVSVEACTSLPLGPIGVLRVVARDQDYDLSDLMDEGSPASSESRNQSPASRYRAPFPTCNLVQQNLKRWQPCGKHTAKQRKAKLVDGSSAKFPGTLQTAASCCLQELGVQHLGGVLRGGAANRGSQRQRRGPDGLGRLPALCAASRAAADCGLLHPGLARPCVQGLLSESCSTPAVTSEVLWQPDRYSFSGLQRQPSECAGTQASSASPDASSFRQMASPINASCHAS